MVTIWSKALSKVLMSLKKIDPILKWLTQYCQTKFDLVWWYNWNPCLLFFIILFWSESCWIALVTWLYKLLVRKMTSRGDTFVWVKKILMMNTSSSQLQACCPFLINRKIWSNSRADISYLVKYKGSSQKNRIYECLSSLATSIYIRDREMHNFYLKCLKVYVSVYFKVFSGDYERLIRFMKFLKFTKFEISVV